MFKRFAVLGIIFCIFSLAHAGINNDVRQTGVNDCVTTSFTELDPVEEVNPRLDTPPDFI